MPKIKKSELNTAFKIDLNNINKQLNYVTVIKILKYFEFFNFLITSHYINYIYNLHLHLHKILILINISFSIKQ